MAVRARIMMLIFLFLLPVNVSAQEERKPLLELRSYNLVVAYPEGLEAEARHITDIYPGIRDGLEDRLGLPADVPHAVVIVADYDTFVQSTGSNLIIAFANGARRLVALDYSIVAKRPASLPDTLTHELCHMVLYEHVTSGGAPESDVLLPRWLNEGICQWASGGASELASLGRGSELEDAVLGGRLIALRRLERAFPGDERGLVLAYAESRSAVEYIVERYGRDAILTMLNQIRQGQGIDFAIKDSLDMTYTEFEEAWQAALRRRYTWITWLGNNIELVLFVAGGAILFLAFLRAIWRYWRYRDEDEFPEGDAPVAPPPPGQSTGHRRLRSRRRGRHVQDEDDGPEYWE